MTLAMSWNEWADHDGIGLAERVRKGEVTAAELAAQAAAGIAKLNPQLDAVVEVFDDVVADPLKDGMNPEEYERELERLLLALAQKSQALQKFEVKK